MIPPETRVKGASVDYRATEIDYSESSMVYSDGFTGTVLRRNLNYAISFKADGYETFSKTIKFAGDNDLVNDKIRLKPKSELPVMQETLEKQEVVETKSFVTLITSIKLTDCEKARAVVVQKTLVNSMDGKSNKSAAGKVISSATICGDLRCALNEGKSVNADFVVFGTIVKKEKSGMKALGSSGEDQYIAAKVTGATYIIELNLLDTSSGKVAVTYIKNHEESRLFKKHNR